MNKTFLLLVFLLNAVGAISGCYSHVKYNGSEYIIPRYANGQQGIIYNTWNPLSLECENSNNTFLYFWFYDVSSTGFYWTSHNQSAGNFNNVDRIANLNFLIFNYDFLQQRDVELFNVTGVLSSSGRQINLNNGQRRYLIFYTNKTICGFTNSTSLTNPQCIYVPSNIYNLSISWFTQRTASGVWYRVNDTWFFNPEINKPLFNKFIFYFYTNSQTDLTRNGSHVVDYTTNKTYKTFLIRYPNFNKYELAFINPEALPGAFTFKYQIVQQGTNHYKANLRDSYNNLIKPLVIFNNGYIRPYNVDGVSLLPVNTSLFIKGENGNCYNVPPFIPSDYNQIYTLQVETLPCEETKGLISNIPKLPYYLLCNDLNGTFYAIKSKTSEEVNHTLTIEYNNSTVETFLSYGFNYSAYVNISQPSDIVKINYFINSGLMCEWKSVTKWFDIPTFQTGLNENYKTVFVVPLFLVVLVISSVIPYAYAFIFVLNDMFQITSASNLAFLGVALGVSVYITGFNGERSFKALLAFFAIGATYLILFDLITGGQMPFLSNLSENIEQLRVQFENFDLLSLMVTLPTFLINIITFILALPIILTDTVASLLFQLNPLIGSAFNSFKSAIIIITYSYIALKGYEIVRNQFRGV